ncbi:hypothetical protein C9374_002777 [Naegleria lovaniensis]|uniref:Uncharacterized protein n=1 Tax=Naegleria lovaniensis TaxID=51637 RepID=A0AA88GV11_NAELO|nr:uncharacterized protein C9374_002777 [Naegleria lovaniensis]KAG2386331.1 hypothetical protein C9374_002777 [Naegleria lovaniensis]
MLNPPSFTSRAHHHVTQGVVTHSNPMVTQALGMWQQPPLHDERENEVGTSFNNPILLLEESVEELQYQELFQQTSNVRRYNAVGTRYNPIAIDDELTLPTKK